MSYLCIRIAEFPAQTLLSLRPELRQRPVTVLEHEPPLMDLLFERFLSESRGEWPDIDLDLPSGEKREQAIQYVYQRYGELGAAMTANVITYRGKSAAREVGKVLGFGATTLGQLSSLVGHWEWRGPNETMDHQFRHAGFDIRHPRIAKYLELCLRLQDLHRHLGQHSGGMVICQGQLDHVVPIQRASMAGRTVVQWDKEDCADLGLIKVDLLVPLVRRPEHVRRGVESRGVLEESGAAAQL